MPGRPRKDVIREDVVGVYHVWSRCVRRAWLCGYDPVTDQDYSYRKQWIYQWLEELARIFAVDACVFAILANHFHLLLRNRPDLAAQWSDEEVVRRWWQLCPERRDDQGKPAEPTKAEIASWMFDPQRVAELRQRLSSISTFMQYLNQWIANRANAEDGVTGHFFQDRFGCRDLLDEGAILACSIYIDLNEIRAQLADTVENSKNTSAYFRLLARLYQQQRAAAAASATDVPQPGDSLDWLCPVSEQDCAPLLGPANVESVVASHNVLSTSAKSTQAINTATVNKTWRHGFLPISVDEYLEFLDWNARRLVPGKSGVTDDSVPPILERLGIAPEFWLKMIENFEKWFHGAVGSPQKLAEHAARTGRQWVQGIGPMRGALG